jgi:hypothetical protein
VTAAELAGARAARRDGEPADAAAVERSLALGWIAVLPLVVTYELVAACNPAVPRNAAEYLLTLPFQVVMARPELGRYALEILATALAAWSIFHAELGLVRRTAQIALEGLVAAVLLGPVLLVGLSVLGVAPPAIPRPTSVPSPATAAMLVGGAAFEEIVFRVAAIAAIAYAARHTFEWFLGLPRTARALAEATALIGSAVLFAAAHVDAVVGVVAPGGEPYDAARFAWRAIAGLALAALLRWRGMGVAAWCHAFFNLALALGAGPEIFL